MAKYTLAVPSFCVDQGLKDFKDIVKFGDALDWKIYGIEAGNDGNMVIQNMIDKNMFGLGKFKLVASSEMAMLAEVQSFAQQKKPIVFLGWAPHSMNERIDMTYLTGSTAETFGGDDGTATVWTNTRKGFEKDMPNVATFLKNFTFPVAMINQIMTAMHTQERPLPPECRADLAQTPSGDLPKLAEKRNHHRRPTRCTGVCGHPYKNIRITLDAGRGRSLYLPWVPVPALTTPWPTPTRATTGGCPYKTRSDVVICPATPGTPIPKDGPPRQKHSGG